LLQAIRLAAPPGSGVLASRFSSGQTSFPRVLFDVETFLETLYQRGLVLKDGVDNPRPSPELNGSPEKSDSNQNCAHRTPGDPLRAGRMHDSGFAEGDAFRRGLCGKALLGKELHLQNARRVDLPVQFQMCAVLQHDPQRRGERTEPSGMGIGFTATRGPGPLISRASDILIAAIAAARDRLLSLVEPRKRRPRAVKSYQ
jgi:hypothetical protein